MAFDEYSRKAAAKISKKIITKIINYRQCSLLEVLKKTTIFAII